MSEILRSHPVRVKGLIRFCRFAENCVVLVTACDHARVLQFSVFSLLDSTWHKCFALYPTFSSLAIPDDDFGDLAEVEEYEIIEEADLIEENKDEDDALMKLLDITIWNDHLIAAFIDQSIEHIHIVMRKPLVECSRNSSSNITEEQDGNNSWTCVASLPLQLNELFENLYVSGTLNRFVTGLNRSCPEMLHFVSMIEVYEEDSEEPYSVLRVFEINMQNALRGCSQDLVQNCIVNATLDTELKAPMSLGVHMNSGVLYIPVWRQKEGVIRYSCIDVTNYNSKDQLEPKMCLNIGASSSSARQRGSQQIIVGNEYSLDTLQQNNYNNNANGRPKVQKWYSCGNCTAVEGYFMIGYFGADVVNANGLRRRRVCQVKFCSGVLVLHQLLELETPSSHVGIACHLSDGLICAWNYVNNTSFSAVQLTIYSINPPRLKLLAAQCLFRTPEVQKVMQDKTVLRKIGVPKDYCDQLVSGCASCKTWRRLTTTKTWRSLTNSWLDKFSEHDYIFATFLPSFVVEFL